MICALKAGLTRSCAKRGKLECSGGETTARGSLARPSRFNPDTAFATTPLSSPVRGRFYDDTHGRSRQLATK